MLWMLFGIFLCTLAQRYSFLTERSKLTWFISSYLDPEVAQYAMSEWLHISGIFKIIRIHLGRQIVPHYPLCFSIFLNCYRSSLLHFLGKFLHLLIPTSSDCTASRVITTWKVQVKLRCTILNNDNCYSAEWE